MHDLGQRIGALHGGVQILDAVEARSGTQCRAPFVETSLDGHEGPVVAATDYIRAFLEMVRPYVPRRYRVLGTDGFGRSDYRVALRRFFEVDRHHLVLAAVRVLADEGAVDAAQVAAAIERYEIDTRRSGGKRTSSSPTSGDVPAIELLVDVRQVIQVDDPLVTLESDNGCR